MRVWDALSKETLSVIQGFHTKGVCAVHFSCNGKLLVTVGIDAAHSIAVWKWAEGKVTNLIQVVLLLLDGGLSRST